MPLSGYLVLDDGSDVSAIQLDTTALVWLKESLKLGLHQARRDWRKEPIAIERVRTEIEAQMKRRVSEVGQQMSDAGQPAAAPESGGSRTAKDSGGQRNPGPAAGLPADEHEPVAALISFQTAGKILGLSTKSISRRVAAGHLTRVGRQVRRSEVMALAEGGPL